MRKNLFANTGIWRCGEVNFLRQSNKSKTKYFYSSLLIFVVVINVLVYLQFTETFGSRSSFSENNFTENIQLQNGDLVLRNGKGLFSTIFRNSSMQQPRFTHAGLLLKTSNQWFVYHFIDDDSQSGLHIETLSHFTGDNVCNTYAFYRYTLNLRERQRLVNIMFASRKQSIPFDSDFNLATDSAMYCTEWIAKALNKTTAKENFIPRTTIADYTYIAPDNLYLNTHCHLLYKNEN